MKNSESLIQYWKEDRIIIDEMDRALPLPPLPIDEVRLRINGRMYVRKFPSIVIAPGDKFILKWEFEIEEFKDEK